MSLVSMGANARINSPRVDSFTEVIEQTTELMKLLAAALPCSKDHGDGITLSGGLIRA